MEKIPEEGAALIVYYHGAIPIDYYYFLASVILQKGRTCHSVADHLVFKIPGMPGLHMHSGVYIILKGERSCSRKRHNPLIVARSLVWRHPYSDIQRHN